MELDLIDAIAEAVVGVKLRRVRVGLEAPAERLLGPAEMAELVNHVVRPPGAFAFQRLAERRVGLEEVVADERWRLVQRSVHVRSRLLVRLGAPVSGMF